MVPLFAIGIALILAARCVGSTLRQDKEVSVPELIDRDIGPFCDVDLFGHVTIV